MGKQKIVFGLGNPGKEYAKTYHSVGRIFLDFLKKKIDQGNDWQASKKEGFEFVKTPGMILVKSLGFMNDSGVAAASIVKHSRITAKDLIVVHDDSDISLGSYKFSVDRGSAGHKGVQSIIDCLKTPAFSRIRIGVRPTNQKKQAGDFVLNQISKRDAEILDKVFLKILTRHFEADNKSD
ncbi:MAG TPA: aminoacyl-tRNA hydrolase [Candidatus Colwellbacteria bacterium]|nr:aminoacyl-tRNA hydrolase [Candidatus Colwellbacteria bacterium]HQA96046.1 aminoacyl-tRNA hydrolase [Candidatus Colwellbacteria bacterium]